MLRSILTTAIRNIFRNKSFSLINLAGLSLSMSLGLLIIMVISEQFTYDNFHVDADRIYRVNTNALRAEGGSEPYASTPLPLGHVIKEDYTFAEEVVTLNRGLNVDATYGNVNVPIRGLFADPSFLTVFNFALERGNSSTVLNTPNSLVLTHAAAEKIFGKADAIGQTISLSGYGEFQVTGILKKFPSKTHFEFEVLASMSSLPLLEKQGTIGQSTDNWNNYYSNYVYFKLKTGHDVAEVQQALDAASKKYYANLKLETRDRGYEFFLLKLTELTPGPVMSNQMGNGMPTLLILFLTILVAVVMIMACFNYTNLMIAKSLSRAREIGIRKVVGAQRFQVFIQFVGEAVIFSVFALLISYLLLQVTKPAFLQLNIAREFDTGLSEDIMVYVYFLLFALAVGVVAGLLPAGYLSAFRPASVLKDTANLRVYSKLTFRKALIVTQFTLSLAFIIVVLVIYNQTDYMVSKDYGIRDENILNVRLQGLEFQKLADEMRSLPGVVRVGGVSHGLGTWADRADDYRTKIEDKPFVMRDFVMDNNYITNLDISIIAGKNFDPASEGQYEKHAILNERALSSFGFADAASAVGQTIIAGDTLTLTVIGVAKNFHFRPLNYEIGPLVIRYNLANLGLLSARILPDQKEAVVASLEGIWKKVDPVHALEWKMMSDEIDDAYTESGFIDVLKIVSYVSFLVVSLACLGMLGMAMYSTRTRFKEIGIRKVMGGGAGEITLLLSKSFLILIAIAAFVGTPLGYFLGDLFLQMYAYKIDISVWLLLGSILAIVLLGAIAIGSQTWKAASVNPAKSLRYE